MADARFDLVRADSPDAQWCLEQYYLELAERFEQGFDLDAAIPADADAMAPPHGAFVVVRHHDRPVGCGGVQAVGGQRADLKRMWLAAAARGSGLGRLLLAELEHQARDLGFAIVQLETNRSLTEAIALYRSAGYVEGPPHNREPHADHWFTKRLVGEPRATSAT